MEWLNHTVLLIGSSDGIYFVSLDTEDHVLQKVPHNVREIVDLDYDPLEMFIYWIDRGRETQKIKRCRIDGSGLIDLPILSQEAREATKIVIDPIGRNLIWLDSTNGRIELMNLQ